VPKNVLDFFDVFIFSFLNVTHQLKKVRAGQIEVGSFQSVNVDILKQKLDALLFGFFLPDLGVLSRCSVAAIDLLPLCNSV